MDNDDWKKSYVPVERRGDDALVMHVRDDGSREFIVAHGYDEESGHWGHGSYYDSVATAAAELEGRAISDTDDVVLADFWTRQDVANALTEADRPATEGNIDAVLSELGLDRYPYGSPFMESIAQMGNEAIADAVGRTGLPDAGARGATLPGRETPDGGSVRAWFMGDSVRDWYTDAYPDDDLGPEIAPDLSFLSALGAVSRGGGFYDVLGVGDSAVRERVFHELAKRTGLTYDDIYGAWIEEKPVKGFPQHEITKDMVREGIEQGVIRFEANPDEGNPWKTVCCIGNGYFYFVDTTDISPEDYIRMNANNLDMVVDDVWEALNSEVLYDYTDDYERYAAMLSEPQLSETRRKVPLAQGRDGLMAVGAGQAFNLMPTEAVTGIGLMDSGTVVSVDGKDYHLMKGATYADSRKVDALLDSRGEMRVGDHKAAARGDASLSAQAEAMRSSSTALSQGGGHGEDVPPRPVGR